MPMMTGICKIGMNINPFSKEGRQALVDGMKHNKLIQSTNICSPSHANCSQLLASFYAQRNQQC